MNELDVANLVITAIATLAAAFGGAWYAFSLTTKAAERRETRGHIAAINRAQFALISQVSLLQNIQEQFIGPVREHPGRCIAMRPVMGPMFENLPRFDATELLFLLETDDRELPFLVMTECQRFHVAMAALESRSRFHLDEAQPKLAAAGVMEGGEYTERQIVAALGPLAFTRLRRDTDEVIDAVDRAVVSSVQLIARSYEAMRRRYPKARIVRLAPNN